MSVTALASAQPQPATTSAAQPPKAVLDQLPGARLVPSFSSGSGALPPSMLFLQNPPSGDEGNDHWLIQLGWNDAQMKQQMNRAGMKGDDFNGLEQPFVMVPRSDEGGQITWEKIDLSWDGRAERDTHGTLVDGGDQDVYMRQVHDENAFDRATIDDLGVWFGAMTNVGPVLLKAPVGLESE